jgi:hypothetical protein
LGGDSRRNAEEARGILEIRDFHEEVVTDLPGRIGVDPQGSGSARFAGLRGRRGSRFQFFVLHFKSISSANGSGLGNQC